MPDCVHYHSKNHPSFCGAEGFYPTVVHNNVQRSISKVFSQVQDVDTKDHSLKCRVFWDNGSDQSLVSHDFENKLGLLGPKDRFDMETITSSIGVKEGLIYNIHIKDRRGKLHLIKSFGVDHISSVPAVGLSHWTNYLQLFLAYPRVLSNFSHEVQEISSLEVTILVFILL